MTSDQLRFPHEYTSSVNATPLAGRDVLEGHEPPKIALIYDFDKTLSTSNMQDYSFIPGVNSTPAEFWTEVTEFVQREQMDSILGYMYLMIRKSRQADKPIRREDFRALGKDIEYFPGVIDWFARMNAFGIQSGARIEHYIISSGLKEIIEGSKLAHVFKRVYACEFLYDVNGVASWPKVSVNYTGKTQYLFRINKGVLDPSDDVRMNAYTPEDDRPIPFRNMIYLGDGLTDVPCMRLVKDYGGKSIAVAHEGSQAVAEELLINGRVNFVADADYREGSDLDVLIKRIILQMLRADELVDHENHQKSLIGLGADRSEK